MHAMVGTNRHLLPPLPSSQLDDVSSHNGQRPSIPSFCRLSHIPTASCERSVAGGFTLASHKRKGLPAIVAHMWICGCDYTHLTLSLGERDRQQYHV